VDDSERRGFYRYSRRILITSVIFVIFLSSCSQVDVLVVSDPYIKMIEGNYWGPLNPVFKVKALLSGYRIISSQLNPGDELSSIISRYEPQVDIIIISPWNVQFLNNLSEGNSRFIIAGGYPSESLPEWMYQNLTAVVPDRSSVMAQLGDIACRIAVETKKHALALYLSTYHHEKEMAILLQSFEDSESIVVRKVAGNRVDGQIELPSDFLEIAGESSLLLLFAGPLNVTALSSTDDSLIPVITESIKNSGAWYDRIIASVEDNDKELRKALLLELKFESSEGVRYYPSTLSKGVLFGSMSR